MRPRCAPKLRGYSSSATATQRFWVSEGFAEQALTEHLELPHSGFAPENFTTLPHFSVSSAISLPKSADEPASTVPPKSAIRDFMLGSPRAALISLFSVSTISADVFLGAPRPCTALVSYPETKSFTVGTSGSNSERLALVTA